MVRSFSFPLNAYDSAIIQCDKCEEFDSHVFCFRVRKEGREVFQNLCIACKTACASQLVHCPSDDFYIPVIGDSDDEEEREEEDQESMDVEVVKEVNKREEGNYGKQEEDVDMLDGTCAVSLFLLFSFSDLFFSAVGHAEFLPCSDGEGVMSAPSTAKVTKDEEDETVLALNMLRYGSILASLSRPIQI